MHQPVRLIAALSALALFVACPPNRGGGETPGGGGGGGSDSLWVVLTQVQGEESWVDHQFLRSNVPAFCSTMRGVFEAYVEAYTAYYEASAAFQEKWGDSYDYENPDYRRDYCNIWRTYYDAFAEAYSPFDNGRWLTTIDLDRDTPAEGEYVREDYDDYYYDDDERGEVGDGFWYGRTIFHDNYYRLYAEAYDCDAYAKDPYAYLYPDDEVIDAAYDSFSLTSGTLTLTEVSGSTWRLVLNGIERDEDGEESELALDDTFDRCEIEYELPEYDYGY